MSHHESVESRNYSQYDHNQQQWHDQRKRRNRVQAENSLRIVRSLKQRGRNNRG